VFNAHGRCTVLKPSVQLMLHGKQGFFELGTLNSMR
jgi:hypothetical protein